MLGTLKIFVTWCPIYDPLSSSLGFHFAIIFKGFPIEDLKLKTKDKLSKVQTMV
jgi:hypothetical protein